MANENPWSKPGYVDQSVDDKAEEYTDEFINDSDTTGARSKSRLKDLYQEQLNTEATDLNKNQNANYAKDGGQYGRFNNRDYSTTLRLAREADAYNSRPLEHTTFNLGRSVQDLGVGYEKPKLETMETRAMEQTQQLDTNQKILAQALQDAVNHKDLNAFIQVYQQLYGITLDEYHAQIEMQQYLRRMQQQNLFTKNMARWQAEFTRAFSAETAQYIMSQVTTNPMWASMLAQVLGGWAAPSQMELIAQDIINKRTQELIDQGMDDWSALRQAAKEAQIELQLDYDEVEQIVRAVQSKKGKAKKKGKAEVNEAIEKRYG